MKENLFEKLLGSWILEELTEVSVDNGDITYPMGHDPKGVIIYNKDGYMSAQIMNPERGALNEEFMAGASIENSNREVSSYLAYSGPFHAHAENQTVSHTMYISLFPQWIGQTQQRKVQFENGVLLLESAKPFISNGKEVVHKLRWKKILKS